VDLSKQVEAGGSFGQRLLGCFKEASSREAIRDLARCWGYEAPGRVQDEISHNLGNELEL
jgi:hypothetical protein